METALRSRQISAAKCGTGKLEAAPSFFEEEPVEVEPELPEVELPEPEDPVPVETVPLALLVTVKILPPVDKLAAVDQVLE